MAAERAPDLHSEVWIIPTAGDRRRRPRRRVVAAVIGAVLTVALGAYLVAPGTGGHPRTAATRPGPAGVAAAYGYPLRCLTITTAAVDPTYARADFDRANACGRYAWSVVAIFHRADGRWRRLLDDSDYACPAAGLPREVQAELSVCP